MTQVQTSPTICPQCHKALKMMLVRGGQRALRCVDCGQPDPMHDAETSRWLNSELRAMK